MQVIRENMTINDKYLRVEAVMWEADDEGPLCFEVESVTYEGTYYLGREVRVSGEMMERILAELHTKYADG